MFPLLLSPLRYWSRVKIPFVTSTFHAHSALMTFPLLNWLLPMYGFLQYRILQVPHPPIFFLNALEMFYLQILHGASWVGVVPPLTSIFVGTTSIVYQLPVTLGLYEVFPHSCLQTQHYFWTPHCVAPQLQEIFHEPILMNITAVKPSSCFQWLCSWRSLGIFLLNMPPCCSSSSTKPLCSVLTTACFCNLLFSILWEISSGICQSIKLE